MNKELKISIITSVFYFVFYNLISYTFSKSLKISLSLTSTMIFFIVYYFLLKYINKRKL